MHMSMLKLVMPTSVEESVSAKVAYVDVPGWSMVPSLFQVTVIGPFTVVPLHLVVVMFIVSARPLL